MSFTCVATRADGRPCTQKVAEPGTDCGRHTSDRAFGADRFEGVDERFLDVAGPVVVFEHGAISEEPRPDVEAVEVDGSLVTPPIRFCVYQVSPQGLFHVSVYETWGQALNDEGVKVDAQERPEMVSDVVTWSRTGVYRDLDHPEGWATADPVVVNVSDGESAREWLGRKGDIPTVAELVEQGKQDVARESKANFEQAKDEAERGILFDGG